MTDALVVKARDVRAGSALADRELAARVRAEQERQDAVAEAFAAGHAAGREAALAEGAGAAVRGAAALEALVAAAQRLHAHEVDASSRAVLASALDLAEWVLRHELPASSRSLLARLGEAAHALLPSATTRVLVSPVDADAVRGWAAGRSGVEVVVDPALAAGDASLDTDAGSVDVSVAAALRIAAETLGVDPARGVE
jgi:flagellar biosynthesis/type III secretory pathway protein FliH